MKQNWFVYKFICIKIINIDTSTNVNSMKMKIEKLHIIIVCYHFVSAYISPNMTSMKMMTQIVYKNIVSLQSVFSYATPKLTSLKMENSQASQYGFTSVRIYICFTIMNFSETAQPQTLQEYSLLLVCFIMAHMWITKFSFGKR